MSDMKWNDLSAFEKDAMNHAVEYGFVYGSDDDNDADDSWAHVVINSLLKRGLIEGNSEVKGYEPTPTGRALVASMPEYQDATIEPLLDARTNFVSLCTGIATRRVARLYHRRMIVTSGGHIFIMACGLKGLSRTLMM